MKAELIEDNPTKERSRIPWLTTPAVVTKVFAAFRGTPKRPNESLQEITPQKILIIRLDLCGDLILHLSFLEALRKRYPNAQIDFLVRSSLSALFRNNPNISRIISAPEKLFHPSGVTTWELLRRHIAIMRFCGKELTSRCYDLAVDARWDVDFYNSGYFAFFSGAKRRIAYSEGENAYKQARNRGFNCFYTDLIRGEEDLHEYERSKVMASQIGAIEYPRSPRLLLSEDEIQQASKSLEGGGIDTSKPLVALSPGASHAKRIWPLKNYKEILRWLSKECDIQVLLIGGPDDVEIERVLHADDLTFVSYVGKASWRETASLLSHCSLFIGSDSGPKHVAASVGVPVVEISCHPKTGAKMHYNSPYRFGAYGVQAEVIQPDTTTSPCTDGCEAAAAHCIGSISTHEVKAAVSRLTN